MREAQGRIEEAATLYRTALEGDHDARPARLQLGWILLTQGRDVEAAEQFRIMTSVEDTETAGFLFRAAAAYGRAGREPEALDYARRARARALADGQHDLVAAIDRVLEGAPAR